MTTVSVRYIVDNVDAAIEFYTKHLDFRVDLHPAPGFASLSRGNLRLLLNAPGAGVRDNPCPTGANPPLAVGTASRSKSQTSPPRSTPCVRPGRIFGTTSSSATAACRSCLTIPRVTASSYSSRHSSDLAGLAVAVSWRL